jgi:hypothetical protein
MSATPNTSAAYALIAAACAPAPAPRASGSWVAGPFQKERAVASNPTTIPGPFIEQPARYTPVTNLKTAKALGITVPPSLLVLADKVIQ